LMPAKILTMLLNSLRRLLGRRLNSQTKMLSRKKVLLKSRTNQEHLRPVFLGPMIRRGSSNPVGKRIARASKLNYNNYIGSLSRKKYKIKGLLKIKKMAKSLNMVTKSNSSILIHRNTCKPLNLALMKTILVTRSNLRFKGLNSVISK
jgi:hypothetical protein